MRFPVPAPLAALALAAGLTGSTPARAQEPPPPTPAIGSLTGRVVDDTLGQPRVDPRAFVQLLRCNPDRVCETLVPFVDVDDQGQFRFESTPERPIPAGALTLEARSALYFPTRLPVVVGAGENADVGDVELRLTSASAITGIARTCRVPAEGGRCEYAYFVENYQRTALTGAFLSRVDVLASSDPLAYLSRFEANPQGGDRAIERAPLAVGPGRREEFPFAFDVPASLPNGTAICANFFFGFNPLPVLRTASSGSLLCFRKGSSEPVPARPSIALPRRDVTIDSPSIAFENLQLCPTVPLGGGTCAYSVDVVNRDALPFAGLARSSAEGTSVFLRPTFFELTGGDGEADVVRPEVALEPFGRTTLTFSLEIADLQPSRNYTPICVRLYLGAEPAPLFTPVREEPLFCLNRTENGFEPVDDRVLP
jgi:hypothetical protein